MRKIVLIAHDIRSTHNVGALLRTADGLGIETVYLSGYTPYPEHAQDDRLPHLRRKIHDQIAKTSLGAEVSQKWMYADDLDGIIDSLRKEGYTIAGLEQSAESVRLPDYAPTEKIALLLGNEVHGIDQQLLRSLDVVVEIPMFGSKESFNVTVAAGMALYHLRFS